LFDEGHTDTERERERFASSSQYRISAFSDNVCEKEMVDFDWRFEAHTLRTVCGAGKKRESEKSAKKSCFFTDFETGEKRV